MSIGHFLVPSLDSSRNSDCSELFAEVTRYAKLHYRSFLCSDGWKLYLLSRHLFSGGGFLGLWLPVFDISGVALRDNFRANGCSAERLTAAALIFEGNASGRPHKLSADSANDPIVRRSESGVGFNGHRLFDAISPALLIDTFCSEIHLFSLLPGSASAAPAIPRSACEVHGLSLDHPGIACGTDPPFAILGAAAA